MQNGLMKHLKKVTLVALSIGLLGGCMPSRSDEKKVIRILYSSVSDFKMAYGNSLQSKFDHIDFQIIEYYSILGDGLWNGFDYVPTSGNDWNAEEFVKLVNEKKPDILYFPVSIYPSLLIENLLKDLSAYSGQYDFSEIDSPIMEALQRMGEGRLYFLSDSLASQAIYYNKDLFSNYGFPEPNDFMTWDEVLTLSNLISVRGIEDEVIGLRSPIYSTAELFILYGKSNGLQWHNPIDKSTSFNNSSWQSVLEAIVEKYKLDSQSPAGGRRYVEQFMNNKIAMVLDTFVLKDELSKSNTTMNWGLVTAPVLKHETDKSFSVTFEYLNGINNSTPHQEDVLEVWAYLNGKDIARKRHNMSLSRYTIPVRSNLIRDDEIRNIAAFYKLSPSISLTSIERNLPRQTDSAVRQYLQDQIQEIINGNLTIDAALSNWDVEIPSIIKEKSE